MDFLLHFFIFFLFFYYCVWVNTKKKRICKPILVSGDRLVCSAYSQGTQVFVTFITVNSENSMQAARLVNKGGKIGKKRNNQTSDPEYEKNCIVSKRKGIGAVCVLTPRLFSHSPTLTSRLGGFLFCF